MLRKVKESLRIKLFILLTTVVIMAVVPLTYSALNLLNDYGVQAIALHSDQVRNQTLSSLQKLTREKANHYQEYFDRIAASAALLGSQASAIYSDLSWYASHPLHDYSFAPSPRTGNFINDISTDPVVTLFWGDTSLSHDILQELQAMSHMTPLYQSVLKENPEVLASHAITASGIGQYYTNRREYRKVASEIPPASVFDLRDGEPVTIFTSNTEPIREVRWTDIYKDDVIEGFMLTASAPIYDTNDRFRGITGIDVPLKTVIDDILNTRQQLDEKWLLFSFLIGEDGKVIAFPRQYYQLFGIEHDSTNYVHSSDRLNTFLSRSTNADVRKLTSIITSGEKHQQKIQIRGENYYVVTSKMSRQKWIFGIVSKEKDVLSDVAASRDDLASSIREMVIKSIYFSFATIGIAVIVIFLLLKHLITPLHKLAMATKRVAAGDLDVHCPVTSRDEPGILAESFNSMVIQLRTAQKQQQMYSDYLEKEVEKQNEEVLSQKRELEGTVTKLQSEVERRKILSEALQLNRQKYYDTLESTQAGLYIIEDFKLTYVNSSFAEKIFHATKDEILGKSPLSLICEEDRHRVEHNLKLRQLGVDIPPYIIRCIRPDGTTFHGEVWSKLSNWRNKEVLVGTITDVTALRQKEQKLQEQDRELQKSLEEKEVLLREIYHRSKNNMLIIISMLELQRGEIEDEQLRSILLEMENRIRSMAIVHERLYSAQNLTSIDMGGYLLEIGQFLLSSMVLDNRIELEIDTDDIAIDIDHAIPVGLVVNEIITNSIKHAFPDERQGKISISIHLCDDNHILLTIADNGIGLPEDVDILQTSSFGTGIIIAGLVQMQLRGKITVERNGGTKYMIRFLEPIQHKRL